MVDRLSCSTWTPPCQRAPLGPQKPKKASKTTQAAVCGFDCREYALFSLKKRGSVCFFVCFVQTTDTFLQFSSLTYFCLTPLHDKFALYSCRFTTTEIHWTRSFVVFCELFYLLPNHYVKKFYVTLAECRVGRIQNSVHSTTLIFYFSKIGRRTFHPRHINWR